MEVDDEQQQQAMDVGEDGEDVFVLENNEEGEDGVVVERGADGKLHRRILGIDESGQVSVPKPMPAIEPTGHRAALAAKNSPSLIKFLCNYYQVGGQDDLTKIDALSMEGRPACHRSRLRTVRIPMSFEGSPAAFDKLVEQGIPIRLSVRQAIGGDLNRLLPRRNLGKDKQQHVEPMSYADVEHNTVMGHIHSIQLDMPVSTFPVSFGIATNGLPAAYRETLNTQRAELEKIFDATPRDTEILRHMPPTPPELLQKMQHAKGHGDRLRQEANISLRQKMAQQQQQQQQQQNAQQDASESKAVELDAQFRNHIKPVTLLQHVDNGYHGIEVVNSFGGITVRHLGRGLIPLTPAQAYELGFPAPPASHEAKAPEDPNVPRVYNSWVIVPSDHPLAHVANLPASEIERYGFEVHQFQLQDGRLIPWVVMDNWTLDNYIRQTIQHALIKVDGDRCSIPDVYIEMLPLNGKTWLQCCYPGQHTIVGRWEFTLMLTYTMFPTNFRDDASLVCKISENFPRMSMDMRNKMNDGTQSYLEDMKERNRKRQEGDKGEKQQQSQHEEEAAPSAPQSVYQYDDNAGSAQMQAWGQ